MFLICGTIRNVLSCESCALVRRSEDRFRTVLSGCGGNLCCAAHEPSNRHHGKLLVHLVAKGSLASSFERNNTKVPESWGYPNSWMAYDGNSYYNGWEMGIPPFLGNLHTGSSTQSQSAEFCRGFLRCRGDIGFGISRPGCQASRWVDGHSVGLVLSPKQHAICTQLITALNSLCMGVVPFVPRRQIQKHRGSNMQQRKLQGFLKWCPWHLLQEVAMMQHLSCQTKTTTCYLAVPVAQLGLCGTVEHKFSFVH